MVRLTDRPDMTIDVYRGRKTTMQQQQLLIYCNFLIRHNLVNVSKYMGLCMFFLFRTFSKGLDQMNVNEFFTIVYSCGP